jgi:hypothetical protein
MIGGNMLFDVEVVEQLCRFRLRTHHRRILHQAGETESRRRDPINRRLFQRYHLFVAIDRTSKFAFAQLVEKSLPSDSISFPRSFD